MRHGVRVQPDQLKFLVSIAVYFHTFHVQFNTYFNTRNASSKNI